MKYILQNIFVAFGFLSIFSTMDALKVAITSESDVKSKAVQESFKSCFPDESIEIIDFKTGSLPLVDQPRPPSIWCRWPEPFQWNLQPSLRFVSWKGAKTWGYPPLTS